MNTFGDSKNAAFLKLWPVKMFSQVDKFLLLKKEVFMIG